MFDMPGSRGRPGARGKQVVVAQGTQNTVGPVARVNTLLVQGNADGAGGGNEILGVQSVHSVVNINMYGALPSSTVPGQGFAAVRTAAIQSGAVPSSNGGYLEFYTKAPGATDAPTLALTIDSSQLVNIGNALSSGSVAQAELAINGYKFLTAAAAGAVTPYNRVWRSDGGEGITLGGAVSSTPDNTTYYTNQQHNFQNQAENWQFAAIYGSTATGQANINMAGGTLFATVMGSSLSTPYTRIMNSAGAEAVALGGGGSAPDNTNYISNQSIVFKSKDLNTAWATISGSSANATGQLNLAGNLTVLSQYSSAHAPNYSFFYDPSANVAFQAGGGSTTPDNNNYYFNGGHSFRSKGNTVVWGGISGSSASLTGVIQLSHTGLNFCQMQASSAAATTYTEIFDSAGNTSLFLGGGGSSSPDPENYYRNTAHNIENINGAVRIAHLSTSGIQFTQYSSGFLNTDASGNVTANGTLFTTLTKSATADVALNNTSSFFPGPSVAQGTSGVWFVAGNLTFTDTSAAAEFMAKLWDGTTVINSGATVGAAVNEQASICLTGVITNPAGNLRIDGRDANTVNGGMRFNITGQGKDCTITAIRIG